MKRIPGLPLIVIGAILALAPIVTHAISSERARERIAEFYTRNPNGAVLPLEMRPSDYTIYDLACLAFGVAIAFNGVSESSALGSVKPQARETTEA